MNMIIEFLVKYVWQFPQMLAAWIWYLIRRKSVKGVTEGKYYTIYRGTNKGGITLGDKIFLTDRYHGEYLSLVIAHESGHVMQSKYLGPLYLFVIGIPSILWAAFHKSLFPRTSYYAFYTEKWANKLGGVAINDCGTLTWAHLVK